MKMRRCPVKNCDINCAHRENHEETPNCTNGECPECEIVNPGLVDLRVIFQPIYDALSTAEEKLKRVLGND